MRIQLPEQISIELPVASYGSRALAYITDMVIRWTALVLTVAATLYVASYFVPVGETIRRSIRKIDDGPEHLWLFGLMVLGIFAFEWGYAIFFEVCRQGASPGKRCFGLRVVDEHGLPITFRASILRNVLLVVDMLPAFGMVACISMLVTKRSQRLGDLIAGTMVIYDYDGTALGAGAHSELHERSLRLPLKHYNLLASYLERHERLAASSREGMEQQLFEAIRTSVRTTNGAMKQPDEFATVTLWLEWVHRESQPEEASYERSGNRPQAGPRDR